MTMKKQLSLGLLLTALAQPSSAALLGTELSLDTIFQSTPASPISSLSFLTTATVVEPGVEFPDVGALEVDDPPFGLFLVDVAIDVGDNFIEIDFDNAGNGQFAPGFQNTYIFTFDSAVAATITAAAIDSTVTTLGLVASDVGFAGNQLFINVENLSFNAATFARVNLLVEGGPSPIPLPAAAWLLAPALIGLGRFARRPGDMAMVEPQQTGPSARCFM